MSVGRTAMKFVSDIYFTLWIKCNHFNDVLLFHVPSSINHHQVKFKFFQYFDSWSNTQPGNQTNLTNSCFICSGRCIRPGLPPVHTDFQQTWPISGQSQLFIYCNMGQVWYNEWQRSVIAPDSQKSCHTCSGCNRIDLQQIRGILIRTRW